VRLHPNLIALAAGLVSATGFAPLNFLPLTLVCLAYLIHLVNDAQTARVAFARGYWFGVGHFTLGLNWIAGSFRYQETMPAWLGWVAVPLLALYLGVFPGLAAGGARWLLSLRPGRGLLTLVSLLAALWTLSEYLRATLFTGFAWNPLGVILVHWHLAGLAAWIGTYGLSAIVLLFSGSLLLVVRKQWVSGLAMLVTLSCLVEATVIDAAKRNILADLALAGRPSIRIVQPNIAQQDKQDSSFDAANFAKLEALSGKPGTQPRLILWPEAAIPDFLEEEPWARKKLATLMGPSDVLLTGGDAMVYDRPNHVSGARNSLFAMTADARLIGRYDKAHLVPYGEYLPMRSILSAIGLSRLVGGDVEFLPGVGPQTLVLPGFGKAGVQICYEIIFSGQVIDRNNRPDFLFNPSNDAWFGSWGPPQHLAQGQLRALEEGIPVIRSTPTGISAVIDADGTLLRTLPYKQPGFIDSHLPKARPATLFARYGNLLPLSLAILLVLLTIAIPVRRR
jgi:apolipoprotein N-acyltransferase